MRPEQLPLDLPVRNAMNAAGFVVSDSNQDAVAWTDRWPDWPNGILAVYGPPGCGKTHLAHVWLEKVWQARSAARFLEPSGLEQLPQGENLILDGIRLPEEHLFHLINHVRAQKTALLILDREPPARWAVRLPDLASRLAGVPAVAVLPPDDRLLAAVLAKHFADRQVEVAPEVITYLVKQIERSFTAAETMARRLDRAALARRGPITIRLARALLSGEDS
ncbi:DNA replication protein [Dongia sp.]|uniref:DNA replication protein n=1 Tax=Dongia sp. TaxID=1977262 RepID=UPI003753D7FB